VKTEQRYEYIEVDSINKVELHEQESAGFEIYGVSRELRQNHPSFVKLKRSVGKEKK
jgi:hypothetical protein